MTTTTLDQRPPIADHEHVFQPGTTGWTILLLHGTGSDEHDLVDLGAQLAPGAALLSPRGRVREGGVVNRFFARRAANDIDVDDMLARTDELADFIAGAVDAYALDPTRIVALGYSNGANIALSMLLRHPRVLAGAALLRPVLYHVPEPLPDLTGIPVLAAAGGRDPYTPPDVIDHLRSTLEQAGAEFELRVDRHAGHGLAQSDLHAARNMISRALTRP